MDQVGKLVQQVTQEHVDLLETQDPVDLPVLQVTLVQLVTLDQLVQLELRAHLDLLDQLETLEMMEILVPLETQVILSPLYV